MERIYTVQISSEWTDEEIIAHVNKIKAKTDKIMDRVLTDEEKAKLIKEMEEIEKLNKTRNVVGEM